MPQDLYLFNGSAGAVNGVELAILLARRHRTRLKIVYVAAADVAAHPRLHRARPHEVTLDGHDKALNPSGEIALNTSPGSLAFVIAEPGEPKPLTDLSDLTPDRFSAGPVSSGSEMGARSPRTRLQGGKRPDLATEATASQNRWPFLECVSIAWDGSVAARRAVELTLPLLSGVKKLYLLCVREDGKSPSSSAAQAIALLGHVEKDANIIELDAPRANVGQALINAADELKSNLLIMGGRGQNARSGWGDTARYVLSHSHLTVLLSD